MALSKNLIASSKLFNSFSIRPKFKYASLLSLSTEIAFCAVALASEYFFNFNCTTDRFVRVEALSGMSSSDFLNLCSA